MAQSQPYVFCPDPLVRITQTEAGKSSTVVPCAFTFTSMALLVNRSNQGALAGACGSGEGGVNVSVGQRDVPLHVLTEVFVEPDLLGLLGIKHVQIHASIRRDGAEQRRIVLDRMGADDGKALHVPSKVRGQFG